MSDFSDSDIARIAATAVAEALKKFQGIERSDASNIALAAAKEAVRETHAELFALLGYNIADFRDINRLRGNMEFLDSLHTGSSKVGARMMFGIITILAGAFCLALWTGTKALIGR